MGEEVLQLIDDPSRGRGNAGSRTVAGSNCSSSWRDGDERAARRSLRRQIARLERELADAFVTSFAMRAAPAAPAGPPSPPPLVSRAQPRLLDLGELELVRDDLAQRVLDARVTIARRAAEQAEKRRLLERMLLEPGRYRFHRVSCQELGEPGCGAWEVRPKAGLIGMLMGWWQVKLSSGCPLAGGRVPFPVARP